MSPLLDLFSNIENLFETFLQKIKLNRMEVIRMITGATKLCSIG